MPTIEWKKTITIPMSPRMTIAHQGIKPRTARPTINTIKRYCFP
jgi:hypothetical protein